jgi:aspartyl/asparaginyl beta-hydroxylase (cupin superfamily)
VWYPCAEHLPSIKHLVADVMEAVEGAQLGGVLITRIPAGKQVYPHVDQGWHATHYEKFAVQIKGNLGQMFCFKDSQLSPLEGELYWFNNQQPHWVVNNSCEDRITLICCIRRAH